MKKIITLSILICFSFFSSNAQCNTAVLYSFDPSCGGGNNGGIAVTTTGAFGTVAYTLTPGNITNNTGSFINLGPGSYTISATDSLLCTSSVAVTLNNPTPVVINSINHTYCFNNNLNTTVQATGGSGNYSLNIVPNVINIGTNARLNANVTYSITVVDANGCTASTVYTHNPPPYSPITVSYPTNNSSCVLTNGNGAFCATAAGGFPPYSYQLIGTNLSNTTGCFSNLNFGYYSVEITDANGCVLYDSTGTSITNSNPTNIAYNTTHPSHCNASDGSICGISAQSATAPLEYSLNSGPYQTSNCFTNLSGGVYTITVKDANNCTGTTTATLVGASPSVNLTFTNPTCATANGQICANVFFGTPPYTYSINNGPGQASNCFTSLVAGNYTVTVTDANGCTGSRSQFLNSNQPFLNFPSSTLQTCNSLGSLQITPMAGANLPITYTLMPGNVTNTTGIFTGLTSGNYTIQGTDALGCINIKNGSVSLNNFYPGSLTGVNNGGILTLTAPAGMTPPLQYRANFGAWQNSNTFTIPICGGSFYTQVRDANGCTTNSSFNFAAPTALPGYAINANLTDPSCGVNDGQIDIIVSPPNPSLTYCTNPGCSNTSSLFTGLGNGNYAHYISDGIGCAKVSYNLNSTANCGSLNGKVFHDANTNCTQDISEINLANQQIILAPGGGVTYTNTSGNYFINNIPFGANILFQNPDNFFAANSCGNYFPLTFLPFNTNYTRNFADTLFNSAQDAKPVVTSATNFTPGFNTTIRIVPFRSNQFTPFTGQISFTLDNDLTFVNSSRTPTNISGNVYTFNYINSNPININVLTPVNTMLNTPIENTAITTLSSSVDANPMNDTFVQSTVVLGAYDPNNKLVTPAGEGPNHHIAKEDSILTYTINFQNVGNAPAHKVVLIDTLTEKLEIFKFKTIYSSHDYVLEIIDNSILKVTYNNIMLADSASNEPASHGQFVFQIHQKGNNNYGNVIRNRAGIYFDYNPPIITNQTFLTLHKQVSTSIINEDKLSFQFSLTPNPAKEHLFISFEKNTNALASVLDVSGKVLNTFEINNSKREELDISSLASGLYFIQVESNSRKELKKFIKR